MQRLPSKSQEVLKSNFKLSQKLNILIIFLFSMNSKRVILVHGWDGNPNDAWKPWLKKELTKRGIDFITPQMPGGEHPNLSEWIKTISDNAGNPNENTFFIGHSLGCVAIAHYLGSLEESAKVGGCVLIAGFYEDLNEPSISNFTDVEPDFEKIKKISKKFIFIASEDDDAVPFDKAVNFQKKLDAKLVIDNGKSHFSETDKVKKLPSALQALEELFNGA